MDAKSEAYYHLAILACSTPSEAGTPRSNELLRNLLHRYGSFEFAYTKLGASPSPDTAKKLAQARAYLEKSPLEFKISSCNDLDFPQALNEISIATPVIYYQGNIALANRDCIAVVGTRQSLSSSEIADAKKALDAILKKNYVIVSGLAAGCDTLAHKAGLQKGTIAVLGTPLNRHYPQENYELQEEIAEKHLLISQFPIGIDRFLNYKYEQPLNFKKRNQTTVALANKGVLVIKTADKGGTQNAIREAKSLGKPLYALSFNFNSSNTWTKEFDWEDHGFVKAAK